MRAILRLWLSYCCGSRSARVLTLSGLGLTGLGLVKWLHFPDRAVYVSANFTTWGLAKSALFSIAPLLGILLIFLGAGSMPDLAMRLARGRAPRLLPYARTRILLSMLAQVLLITLLATCVIYSAYYWLPEPLGRVAARSFVVLFLTYSLMYVVLWWMTNHRGTFSLLGGTLLLLICLVVPLRYIALPGTSLVGPIVFSALGWGVFSLHFLAARPTTTVRMLESLRARGAALLPHRRLPDYNALDLLLGTTAPAAYALGQVIPVTVAGWFIANPQAWIQFLVLLASIAGGLACTAAQRSRKLWLRAPHTRAELFRAADGAFWRHHSWALSVLMLLLTGIGTYLNYAVTTLALALPLLLIATAIGHYLGLLIVGEMSWREAVVALACMALLVRTANSTTDADSSIIQTVLWETVALIVAGALRLLAQRRWSRLDFALCRSA